MRRCRRGGATGRVRRGGYVALAPASRAPGTWRFARTGPDGQMAVIVAPRLVAGLLDGARLAAERFASTVVPVPA